MKKAVIILACIVVIVVATVNVFTRNARLTKLAYRPYEQVTLSQGLKDEIREHTSDATVSEIAIYCHEKTRELLRFTLQNHPFDDNRVTGMNCVGYAQVCATLCNYAFMVNKITATARPVVGHVYLFGFCLNSLANIMPTPIYNFTKDHDFVEITCGNQTMTIDPSLNIINPFKHRNLNMISKWAVNRYGSESHSILHPF